MASIGINQSHACTCHSYFYFIIYFIILFCFSYYFVTVETVAYF